MSRKVEIELTADGSTTLYVPSLDEHYHSVFGAMTECYFVYITTGLLWRSGQEQTPVKVFEVGFGTGMNAMFSAATKRPVRYFAIEKYPLPTELNIEVVRNLSGLGDLPRDIIMAPWNSEVLITDTFSLKKIEADFLSFETEEKFDVIYMDAFAPEKQPELWTEAALSKLVDLLAQGGVITTYCAKGRIRRFFEKSGLKVERLPGPPGGKREILRITKVSQ